MANSTARLTNDALAFLTERHLAMLTTLRADNSPHVVAVGFTFDPKIADRFRDMFVTMSGLGGGLTGPRKDDK